MSSADDKESQQPQQYSQSAYDENYDTTIASSLPSLTGSTFDNPVQQLTVTSTLDAVQTLASTSRSTSAETPNENEDEVDDLDEDEGKSRKKGTKRKRFNAACTACRRAHKACSRTRPCERCVKLGIGHLCQSAERKKRKVTKKKWINLQINQEGSKLVIQNQSSTIPQPQQHPGMQMPMHQDPKRIIIQQPSYDHMNNAASTTTSPLMYQQHHQQHHHHLQQHNAAAAHYHHAHTVAHHQQHHHLHQSQVQNHHQQQQPYFGVGEVMGSQKLLNPYVPTSSVPTASHLFSSSAVSSSYPSSLSSGTVVSKYRNNSIAGGAPANYTGQVYPQVPSPSPAGTFGASPGNPMGLPPLQQLYTNSNPPHSSHPPHSQSSQPSQQPPSNQQQQQPSPQHSPASDLGHARVVPSYMFNQQQQQQQQQHPPPTHQYDMSATAAGSNPYSESNQYAAPGRQTQIQQQVLNLLASQNMGVKPNEAAAHQMGFLQEMQGGGLSSTGEEGIASQQQQQQPQNSQQQQQQNYISLSLPFMNLLETVQQQQGGKNESGAAGNVVERSRGAVEYYQQMQQQHSQQQQQSSNQGAQVLTRSYFPQMDPSQQRLGESYALLQQQHQSNASPSSAYPTASDNPQAAYIGMMSRQAAAAAAAASQAADVSNANGGQQGSKMNLKHVLN